MNSNPAGGKCKKILSPADIRHLRPPPHKGLPRGLGRRETSPSDAAGTPDRGTPSQPGPKANEAWAVSCQGRGVAVKPNGAVSTNVVNSPSDADACFGRLGF